MSDFYKKRVDYINNWPDSKPFDAELKYKKICDDFKEKNDRLPFTPMKMWELCDVNPRDVDSSDVHPLDSNTINIVYNRVLSHIIECLDLIPYKPNLAFYSLFTGFDDFSEIVYQKMGKPNNSRGKNKAEQITCRLKFFYNDITSTSLTNNNIIEDILKEIFGCIPLDICKYLFINLKSENGTAYKRVTQDTVPQTISMYEQLIKGIIAKYDYDNVISSTTEKDRNKTAGELRTKAGKVYKKIFTQNSITLDDRRISIDNKFRLNLLISGILYTLRNDSLHGSLMSSTKSSKTDIKRYETNYFCFLSMYTLLMLLLIEHSFDDGDKKISYYNELLNTTKANVSDFKSLFKA